MKTTIELPDDLLHEAKAVAAGRRISLKAMIEHALRRELGESKPREDADWEKNKYGFPVLVGTDAEAVTSEQIYQMLDDEE